MPPAEQRAARALQHNSGQTLPSSRRIKQRLDFDLTLLGNRYEDDLFAIYTRKNQSGTARLGIIASKRSIPKAVARNFAKRMIREGFRQCFWAGAPLDVVIRVKRKLYSTTSAKGRSALISLLQAAQK